MFISRLPAWLIFIGFIASGFIGEVVGVGPLFLYIVMIIWIQLIAQALYRDKYNNIVMPIKYLKYALLIATVHSVIASTIYKYNWSKHYSVFALFALCCMFWSLYYVAKLLVINEEDTDVKFNRVFGTLFQFFFFPIGVWFIQPRLKRVLEA